MDFRSFKDTSISRPESLFPGFVKSGLARGVVSNRNNIYYKCDSIDIIFNDELLKNESSDPNVFDEKCSFTEWINLYYVI